MRYDEVYLTLDKDTAHEQIVKKVTDVRSTTTDDKIQYRSNTGVLLATLTNTVLPSGERGSKLRYRTTLISPALSHARTQAQSIRRAVGAYRTDKPTSSV
ncbi:hypothetical protein [Haloarchaeobius sp. DFWS5]|uniref:hypothetical protein n=1 Tax=Haloarchaeobius sp. DFWS5 TaxID=3446114 RepID=UPI003EBCA099